MRPPSKPRLAWVARTARAHPLVAPRDPPRCCTPRATPHPPGAHSRLVRMAPSTPGWRKTRSHEPNGATVMLEKFSCKAAILCSHGDLAGALPNPERFASLHKDG